MRAVVDDLDGWPICHCVTMAQAETMATLLNAALNRPASPGWEAIETAPKDGRPVDLWVKQLLANGKVQASRFPDSRWSTTAHEWTDRQGYSIEGAATHYMLPSAPESAT